MIPRVYLTAWRSQAPWPTDAQVEQDLVLNTLSDRTITTLDTNRLCPCRQTKPALHGRQRSDGIHTELENGPSATGFRSLQQTD
jgi:hypothetical protein